MKPSKRGLVTRIGRWYYRQPPDDTRGSDSITAVAIVSLINWFRRRHRSAEKGNSTRE
jgi:hypothetical protein